MERGGSDVRRFEDRLATAKECLDEVCDIFVDMKAQLSERGGMDRRDGRGMHSDYGRRDDWSGLDERRGRDSMGRFR